MMYDKRMWIHGCFDWRRAWDGRQVQAMRRVTPRTTASGHLGLAQVARLTPPYEWWFLSAVRGNDIYELRLIGLYEPYIFF